MGNISGMTHKFRLSRSGIEKVFEDGRWVKVQPGYYLAQLLAPLLRPLSTYPDKGKEDFLAALDSMNPNAVTMPPDEKLREVYLAMNPGVSMEEFRAQEEARFAGFNRNANWLLSNALLAGVLMLLRNRPPRPDGQGGWILEDTKAPRQAHYLLAEFEKSQERRVARRQSAWPVLPWLQGGWGRSRTSPYMEGIQSGFQVESRSLSDAACCELLLMTMSNVRRFRVCPHCLALHWRKDGSVCSACLKRQDKERKAAHPKTDKGRFLNNVAQAKHRGRITAEEQEALKGILAKSGVNAAQGEFRRLVAKHSPSKG